ncbi:nucleotidyl transferase AbiEii/AbiGii toxin family protein, partial [Corynebacterium casei]
VPGPKWEKGYSKQARSAADFPAIYQKLEVALETVGKCLNDLLSGKGISGTWNPDLQRWEQ